MEIAILSGALGATCLHSGFLNKLRCINWLSSGSKYVSKLIGDFIFSL